MKFSGICLVTENIPALVGFYTRVFGVQAQGDDIHAEFHWAGLDLAVYSKSGMDQMAPGCMANFGAGSVTLMFAVEDVDAEFERLKGLGAETVKPPETYAWGSRSLWLKDPDGNIIDLWSRV